MRGITLDKKRAGFRRPFNVPDVQVRCSKTIYGTTWDNGQQIVDNGDKYKL